jgi:hypothetical protein
VFIMVLDSYDTNRVHRQAFANRVAELRVAWRGGGERDVSWSSE